MSGTIAIRTLGRMLLLCLALIMLAACDDRPWNNPYPLKDDGKNILYSEFNERPKHLDPIRSYVSNEYELLAQIYEPVVQYNYLKRPYQLVTLTGTSIPTSAR